MLYSPPNIKLPNGTWPKSKVLLLHGMFWGGFVVSVPRAIDASLICLHGSLKQ